VQLPALNKEKYLTMKTLNEMRQNNRNKVLAQTAPTAEIALPTPGTPETPSIHANTTPAPVVAQGDDFLLIRRDGMFSLSVI
jgi:hypothetical protein